MGLLMSLSSLRSRLVRAPIGIRQFTTKTALGEIQGASPSKLLGLGLYGFGGFLIAQVIETLLQTLIFSFTNLWRDVVFSINYIWNFDWNQSDDTLYKQIDAQVKNLAYNAGTTFGNFIGYAVCGVLPAAKVYTFNESLALYIFRRLGTQALNNLSANLAFLIIHTFQVALTTAFSLAYVNIRHLVRPSDADFKNQLIAEGITNQDQINKAIEQRNKPWSFAKQFDQQVSKIPDDFGLRNFIKGTIQGATMGCVHAGYVIAGALDSYLADARLAYDRELGLDEQVDILFGKKSPTPNASTSSPNTGTSSLPASP
jgi:hypothetical protein